MLDDVQNNKAVAWFDGTRGVILAIQRQPGTNTVAVAQAVRETLRQLAPAIPATVRLQTMYDRSQSIQAEVERGEVHHGAHCDPGGAGDLFVLRRLWATVIPSLVLPLPSSVPSRRCTRWASAWITAP